MAAPASTTAPVPVLGGFAEIYEAHFDFVWRSLRRLGVPERGIDDATHDVFVVAHRRLPDFEGRSTIRTWLFGIAWRVARVHRSREQKTGLGEAVEETPDSERRRPDREAVRRQEVALVQQILERLADDRRAVLVAVEIEQLSVPEVAEALGIPLNTAYSRLRLARRDFEQALRRLEAGHGGRWR